MSRHWHRHLRVTLLGALLCLLAAAFALEAKLGCYSPDGHVRVAISSTKLQPADAPRLIAQALIPPPAVAHSATEAPLFLLLAVLMVLAFVPRQENAIPAPAWFSFSPPLFFRPPPRS